MQLCTQEMFETGGHGGMDFHLLVQTVWSDQAVSRTVGTGASESCKELEPLLATMIGDGLLKGQFFSSFCAAGRGSWVLLNQ
jgi:hypothetical protein